MRGRIDYKTLFHRFTRQSTIHGINHSSQVPSKKWKSFWIAAFVLCFIALCVQIFWLLMKYFEYPKTVDLDVSLFFNRSPWHSFFY